MAAETSLRVMLRSGDRAPLTYGMTSAKAFYSFEAQAGRPAAVILAGSLPPAAVAPLVAACQSRATDFAQTEADMVLLVNAQGPHALDYVANPLLELTVVYCLPAVFEGWDFHDSAPTLVIIDRNLRVIAIIDQDDAPRMAEAALASLATFPVEAPRDIVLPAPVLLIPNIFSTDFCRVLISYFETSNRDPGGMASIDANGNPIHKIDETKKRREDCLLPPDNPLHGLVLEALSRACLPEIKKAFQCDICYVDRILIACYDESGGYFLRHRDNAAPAVAYRQFALSVNLNSGEYEGGYLSFPEYNSHRYKPGRGAGAVFSTSLLHEASAVTAGRRYVLLTFLQNAEAEARRRAAA